MKKKLLVIIPAIIIGFLMALNINICINSLHYDEYKIELASDVGIENVVINNNNIELTRYCNETSKIIQEIVKKDDNEEKVEVLYSELPINIMVSKIDDVTINFYGNIDNVKLNLNENIIKLDSEVYDFYLSKIDVIKTGMDKRFIIIFILALIISYIIIYYLTYFITKFKDSEVKLYEILLAIFCVFLLYLFSVYFLVYLLGGVATFVFIGIGSFILFFYRNNIKENIEKMYLIIAIFVGMTFIFLIPPTHVPDEATHFIKCYDFFDNLLKPNEEKGYCKLPVSIDNFLYKYNEDELNYAANYNPKSYFSNYFEKGEYKKEADYSKNYRNTAFLPIGAYVPNIIVANLLKLTDISPLFLLLSMRFTNFVIMTIISYFIIKNSTRYKYVFFIITLFPILLQQCMGINQDSLTNVMSLAIIGYIFKLKEQNEGINQKNIFLLLTLSIILSLCKFGYFVVTFLIFIIPKEKFKYKRDELFFKFGIIILVILVSYFVNTMMIGIPSSEKSKYITFEYALNHPIEIIKIYYNTFKERSVLDLFNGNFDGFGVSNKWLDKMPQFICSTVYIILLCCSGSEEKKTDKKEKVLLLITFLAMCFVLYSSLLFIWTHVGSNIVEGLQTRYFLVASALLCLFVSNDKVKLNIKNKSIFYSIGVLSVLFWAVYTIILKFY